MLAAECGALVVRVAGERQVSLPLAAVERLVVRGTASLTTGLLATLWQQDAGLLILGGRRSEASARLLGRLWTELGGDPGKFVPLDADTRPMRMDRS